MENSKLFSHEEILDRVIGEKGSPRRNALEAELHSYLIGEAIKQALQQKNLSQKQLGELIHTPNRLFVLTTGHTI